jgi:calcineurin-like phosphoesterase family protein
MYKLLVIDDDWQERKNSYTYLFDDTNSFNIIFLESGVSDLSPIDDPTIDAIILDLYLNYPKKGNGDKTKIENYLREVLKYIGLKKPVVLVSRKFSELASWANIPNEYGVRVIDYFGWPEIFNPTGKIKDNSLKDTTLLRINNSLNKFYNLTNSKKEPDENISIILLSDLQFGDPNFSDETLLSEFNLARYLADNSIYPDFVFILGDISYSGEPSQFDKAYEWLFTFCKKIFPKNFEAINERVFLVPGNHDVNLTLSSADYYKFDFDGYKKSEFLKIRESKLNENKRFGLYPFCDFAFSITKDERWINRKNLLCWVNDRFVNWGLRIITLNSVSELSYEKPTLFEINEDSLKEIADKTERLSENIYTILLAHHGPDDLGYQRGLNSDRKAKNLFSLINTVGGNLFIHGHRHVPSSKYSIEYKGRFTNIINYLMVGTFNLNTVRKHGSQRSFSLLELERKDSKIIDSKVRLFEVIEQTIKEV